MSTSDHCPREASRPITPRPAPTFSKLYPAARALVLGGGLVWLTWAIPWVRSVPSFFLWLLILTLIVIAALAALFCLISFLPRFRSDVFDSPPKLPKSAGVTDTPTLLASVIRIKQSYFNQTDGAFRYVDRFFLEGGVYGWVDDEDDVLYVTFRGTSEAANWFLTNAQAHMVEACAVFQGRAQGGVHEGFVKAFLDLWSYKGPSEDDSRHSTTNERWKAANDYRLTKWLLAPIWMFVLAVPIYAARHWVPDTSLALLGPPYAFSQWNYWDLLLLTGVFVLVVQLFLAYGRFEGFFRRSRPLVIGRRLSDVVSDKAETKSKVVFTGHSLGGAIATLAFVDYVTTAELDKKADVALITFGAPQVGNDAFGHWLLDLPATREPQRTTISLFAGVGDPVPHLPPRRTFFQAALQKPTLIGVVLSAVYVVGWLPYALSYRALLGAEWNSLVHWRGRPGLSFSKHKDTYTKLREEAEATVKGSQTADQTSEATPDLPAASSSHGDLPPGIRDV